jgi:hypothetical protein
MVNDQLDAQFFFLVCLFQFFKCFEQPRAHHQENQFYQHNIWYISFCGGDRLVCKSGRADDHLHRMTYTRCCIDKIDYPDDEREVARNM